jgi:hypothetical protein
VRRPCALLISAIALLAQGDASRADPPIVVSSQADSIAVTIYRAPERRPADAIEFDTDEDADPLRGYAMIAETRTVQLPPGEAVVRFEGVASGIIPQSAVLLGGTLKEKNFDSRLLSQRGLLDAFTGQRVRIRVTDAQTGQVSEEDATIVSQPDRLLLHTKRGYESVACGDGINTVLFPKVPVDLTAKPTLSMTTRPDNPGGKRTVTLLYLADNFDWQANYVLNFTPDGQGLTMLGWMTVASKDKTSFPAAELSAVAGIATRAEVTEEEEEAAEEERENDPYGPANIEMGFSCWPMGTTASTRYHAVLFGPGSLPLREIPIDRERSYYYGMGYYGGGRGCGDDVDSVCEIVVTGSRIAARTDLGDLKLYTVPFPSDVLAQSMKQIRFMDEHTVKGEVLYRIGTSGEDSGGEQLLFRFRNRKADGAGDPLPAGRIAMFQRSEGMRRFLGETWLADKAVDEDVEIQLPNPEKYGIKFDAEELESEDEWADFKATVTNSGRVTRLVEVEFEYEGYKFSRFSKSLKRRKGKWLWSVRLAPGASEELRYRRTEQPREDDAED